MTEFLRIGFINASDVVAIARGRTIVELLADHPYQNGPLPEGVFTPPQIGQLLDRYQVGCNEAVTRLAAKMAILRAIRKEYRVAIKTLAKHLDVWANGDPAKLQNLGFEFKMKPKRGARKLIPEVAPSLEMSHGAISGTMFAKMSAVLGAMLYELHFTVSDPNVEANWALYDKFRNPSKNQVKGLTAGLKYWFRSRGVGSHGEGPWSPPFPLISL